MPVQKNLLHFFKPSSSAPTKRACSSVSNKHNGKQEKGRSRPLDTGKDGNDDQAGNQAKKQRTRSPDPSTGSDCPSTPPPPSTPPAAIPSTSGLTPEQKSRLEQNRIHAQIRLHSRKMPALHASMGASWFKALEQELSKPYFDKLSKFLVEERSSQTIYPPEDQVWTWTNLCTAQQVKVVILGQDPYHGPRQAHGLCFSVQKGVAPPPSLVNMYKELAQDISGFTIPKHGNLTGWARQGVLLLNACLTVRAHEANSHKEKGWEELTDAVIKWISNNRQGVVFLLWGSYAQKKAAVVDKKKHHLLTSVHPSPLSAYRGFFGCQHFSKCNNLLVSQGKTPIDWNDLPNE